MGRAPGAGASHFSAGRVPQLEHNWLYFQHEGKRMARTKVCAYTACLRLCCEFYAVVISCCGELLCGNFSHKYISHFHWFLSSFTFLGEQGCNEA